MSEKQDIECPFCHGAGRVPASAYEPIVDAHECNHAMRIFMRERDALLAAAKAVCERIRNNGYVFANDSPSALGEVHHDVVRYLEILMAAVKECEACEE
jgi:predicted methyltransferase